MRLIVRQSATAAGLGVIIGLGASAGLTRLLSSLLYEVSTFDPAHFGMAASLLFVAALVASFIPARRVLQIDPAEVLRND